MEKQSSKRIGITGWGSISALGHTVEDIWSGYGHPNTGMAHSEKLASWTANIPTHSEVVLQELISKNKYYSELDRSVHLALYAAERAAIGAGWTGAERAGLQIGSSRGATGLWEQRFSEYSAQPAHRLHPLTSPTTTLGNIASWTAQHIGIEGPVVEQSITCSTTLHAFLNAMVWLESGRCTHFMAGGTEAPLTPFTLAQMKALRLSAGDEPTRYPCKAGDTSKKQNTMVLGEGAAMFCMEVAPANAIAWVAGIGFGRESSATPTRLSESGQCLQRSMRMALQEAGLDTVDMLVSHTPGTILGDRAELCAIREVFGKKTPFTTNNKWKIGHTFGASGGLSLELALMSLRHGRFIKVPYLEPAPKDPDGPLHYVMVNAVGFGGNAVSIILARN